MISWFTSNFGTILVGAILLSVVVGVIAVMRRDRSQGKTPCGHGCDHCAMHGQCHSAARQVQQ